MPPHAPSRPLRTAAVLICLVVALLTSSLAAAQATDQRAILTVTVNQAPQGDLVVFVRPADVLVEAAALDRAGLRRYEGRRETIGGREYVSLASLAPGITYVLDEPGLALAIAASVDHLGTVAIDLATKRPDYRFARTTSAFVNYGANWTSHSGATGSLETGLSVGPAVAENTVSWDEQNGFVRGLSSIVIDQPGRVRRFTIGDSMLPAQGLGSGMLIGGVHVARDYGLDPYFIQYPTLALSGTTLTPSTVDVYVNGTLVSRQRVSPGSFSLENLPMPNGSNNTRVVVRDAFGREQQMSAPFYFTTSSLARGLHDYDYSVGFPRLGGAQTNWSYGRLAAVARHRYGFTDRLTAGYSAEGNGSGFAAGPTFNLRVGASDIEASASISRTNGRSGAAFLAGIGHAGRAFNGSLRVRSMTDGYSTLTVVQPDQRLKIEAAGVFGVLLASRLSVSVQQAVSENYAGERSAQSSLIASTKISRNTNLFVNATRASHRGETRTSVYAGVGIVLGPVTSASVMAQVDGASHGMAAEVQRSLPLGNGIGYRARGTLGGTSQAEALIEAQGNYGRYEAGQQVIDGMSTTQLSAAGGLVFIGGGAHATRPVNGSYALVRVPDLPGVRTYLNNQEMGRTNRRGDTLVSNLLPYYANRIGISDQDVPFDRDVDSVEQSIAPPYRGGALVKFAANRRQVVTGTVAITVGGQTVVPALGELTITIGSRTFVSPIGVAGEFYFENLPAGDHLAVLVYKGGTCQVTISVPVSSDSIIRLGVVKCGAPVTPVEDRES